VRECVVLKFFYTSSLNFVWRLQKKPHISLSSRRAGDSDTDIVFKRVLHPAFRQVYFTALYRDISFLCYTVVYTIGYNLCCCRGYFLDWILDSLRAEILPGIDTAVSVVVVQYSLLAHYTAVCGRAEKVRFKGLWNVPTEVVCHDSPGDFIVLLCPHARKSEILQGDSIESVLCLYFVYILVCIRIIKPARFLGLLLVYLLDLFRDLVLYIVWRLKR